MTETERGLLNAVLEVPADDLPRLILADWYEEHQRTIRAQFIRHQIELAQLVQTDQYDSDEYVEASRAVAAVPNAGFHFWVREVGFPLTPGGVYPIDFIADRVNVRDDALPGANFTFRRGFIESIDVPSPWLRDNARRLVEAPIRLIRIQPYTAVNCLTIELHPTAGGWEAVFQAKLQFGRNQASVVWPARRELFRNLIPWMLQTWESWRPWADATVQGGPWSRWWLQNILG